MINNFSAGHRVTIMDVAKAAQVSRQTVSNVVNRPERVREDTRARVQVEIERLGYRPSTAAQSLRAQRAGAVGIELNSLGPNNRNDVVYPFLIELSIAARRHHCHMVPFGSAEDRPMVSGYDDMARTHLVDAFILADTHRGDPRPIWLEQAGVPFATFGRVWDDESFTGWADVDGAAGTSDAVDHLVHAGYQRVGFLGWPSGSETGDLRREGWLSAIRRHGIPGEDLQVETIQDFVVATDAATPLVERVGKGGAIVCASDLLALGALNAIRSAGMEPGKDCGIVGFDDSPLAAMNGLTTLAQPLDQIADHVLQVVGDRLGGAALPETGSIFRPTLVPRGSSSRG